MARNQFAESHFHDEDAARVWFEHCPLAQWPDLPQMRIGQALSRPKSSVCTVVRPLRVARTSPL